MWQSLEEQGGTEEMLEGQGVTATQSSLFDL